MPSKRLARRALTIAEILAWADSFRETTGHWPTVKSGSIREERFETWQNLNQALILGLRGLPGGSSLAQLLAEQRGARNQKSPPPLTVEQVLGWADQYYKLNGKWPKPSSGLIPGSGGEKWKGLDRALTLGIRGLPGESSLAKLFADHRGKRNHPQLPPLDEKQILQWADAYHERTGRWPRRESGLVMEGSLEKWKGVDLALRQGIRGLGGGTSLALFLAERRSVRNVWTRPSFTIAQILEWADAFHARTGQWPNQDSGPIQEAPEETWKAVEMALIKGRRGLTGKSSLARLRAAERGVRNRMALPRLTRKQILTWAVAHRQLMGEWPTRKSGPIVEAPEETWLAIDDGLRDGCRGLRGGSSLARLLDHYYGVPNPANPPRLSKKKILAWADAHFQRTGTWPNTGSGAVHDNPRESWLQINQALRIGTRGLAGGSSLRELLIAKGRKLPQEASMEA
ncbi:MAG: hypothetical protein ACJ8FY_26405 [Gemmataceae bacterium]